MKTSENTKMQLIRESALKTNRMDRFEIACFWIWRSHKNKQTRNHILGKIVSFQNTSPLRGWLRQNMPKEPKNSR